MKLLLSIVAGLLVLVGAAWFLQGINVLPGSFMTGQPQWAVYGATVAIVGLGLLALVNRRRFPASRK